MNTSHRPRVFSRALALLVIAALAPAALRAQAGASAVQLPLRVTNNHGQSTQLVAGVHEFGTKGLDLSIGEAELPPVPPSEISDARFVGTAADITLGEGTLIDFRPWPAGGTATCTHRIAHQAGRAWPSVTLLLPAAFPASIRAVRVDGRAVKAGDSVVSLIPQGDMTIAVDYVIASVTLAVNPDVIVFPLSSRDTALPAPRAVHIIPSTAGARWSASASASWITLDRTSGGGEGDIAIGIDALTFPDGRSTGEVLLSAGGGPPISIAVHVDNVTGIAAPAVAGVFDIGPWYPNPASRSATSSSSIAVTAGMPGAVTVRVVDAIGRLVRTFPDGGGSDAGTRVVRWDLRDARGMPVPAGVYRCIVESRFLRISRSLVVR
ncbi:MAG: hypothetical protein IPP94_18970 [Ignavibacteria bacterium]|nr:hypothetical protein [Ignavibacteria bacterium]